MSWEVAMVGDSGSQGLVELIVYKLIYMVFPALKRGNVYSSGIPSTNRKVIKYCLLITSRKKESCSTLKTNKISEQ